MGDLLTCPAWPQGPGATHPGCARSQLKSLLDVVIVVPVFQLLQDPIQHCRPLFLRGLCGRWQRGKKTQRGLNVRCVCVGEQRCVCGGHKSADERTNMVLVRPASARCLSPASHCCWPSLRPLPSLPQSKGPTLGSQWLPESCSFLPAKGLANPGNSWPDKQEPALFLWQPWTPRVWMSDCQQLS